MQVMELGSAVFNAGPFLLDVLRYLGHVWDQAYVESPITLSFGQPCAPHILLCC